MNAEVFYMKAYRDCITRLLTLMNETGKESLSQADLLQVAAELSDIIDARDDSEG